MSQADFQTFRTHQDQQLLQQYPNGKRRFKEVCKLWGALGDRAAKEAEAVRIRANAVPPPTSPPPATTTDDAPTAPSAPTIVATRAGSAAHDGENGARDEAGNEAGVDTASQIQAAEFLQDMYDQQASLPLVVLYDSNLPTTRAPKSKRRLRNTGDSRNVAKRRKLDFLQSDVGLGEGWIAAGCPATHSLNSVGVWVHLDESGNVDDRVVVKDSDVPADVWSSIHFWSGDITDTQSREPVESAVLRRLKAQGNDPHPFNELRRDRVFLSYRAMVYRLYFAYLPFQDGQAMVDMYSDYDTFFPEPWLWSVFEALARATLIMEQGSSDAPVDNWKQIVHRDLKPGNIFFDFPHTEIYPTYPYPKVGDFGLAIETSPDDLFNPYGLTSENGNPGTVGFIAPENFIWVHKDTREIVDDHKLLSPGNIWGIGATMFAMMTGEAPCVIRTRYHKPDLNQTSDQAVQSGAAPLPYSEYLIGLVHWCLEYNPDDRITARRLLDEILLLTGATGSTQDPYALDLTDGLRRQVGQYFNIEQPEMFWRIGLSRKEVDEKRNGELRFLTVSNHSSRRPTNLGPGSVQLGAGQEAASRQDEERRSPRDGKPRRMKEPWTDQRRYIAAKDEMQRPVGHWRSHYSDIR